MNKVPSLRFKEFSGEWEEKRLGEVSDVRDGTHDSPKYIDNGYPLVTSKNVQNGKIDLKNINYISLEDFEMINKRSKVSKGDILMGMIGTIGNLAIVDRDDFAIKNVALIKEKNVLKNSVLCQILQSNIFYKKLSLLNEGGTQKFISLGNIRNLNFNIPCLEEQEKIGNFLSSVDKKISIVEEKLNLFNEYKKGIMQKIFNQELRFKDENGNNYPQWEEKFLGDIGEFKNGINKGKDDFGIGYPFINLLNVFGKCSIDNNKNLSLVKVTAKELKEFNLLKGDTLFIRSSVKPEGVGLTTVILNDFKDTVYSGFIIRFRENKNLLSLNYKKYCFYEENFRRNLLNKSTISANTNINQDSLKILSIKIPCLEEQKKIADFLSAIDNKIENISDNLESLKLFKKSMLQKMFV